MIGASALQSPHQCAQKKSSTGEPLSCGSRRQWRAQKLIRLQRRRDLPLKRKQIQILLNSIVNRRIAVRPQRRLQQRDRLRLLPACSQHLRLHLERRPERQGQMRLCIERTLLQLFERQRLGLLRISRGLIVLPLVERGASQPRICFEIFRRLRLADCGKN